MSGKKRDLELKLAELEKRRKKVKRQLNSVQEEMSSESENYEDDENSTEEEYGQEDQQDIIGRPPNYLLKHSGKMFRILLLQAVACYHEAEAFCPTIIYTGIAVNIYVNSKQSAEAVEHSQSAPIMQFENWHYFIKTGKNNSYIMNFNFLHHGDSQTFEKITIGHTINSSLTKEAETLEKQEESRDSITTENIENDDEPLDEEFIQIFGDHPNNSKAVKVPYHAEILNRWQHCFQQGMKKDRRDELLEKFENPPGLNPPKMNPEILPKLHKSYKKRNTFMLERQRLAGAALASLGWALSSLVDKKQTLDRAFLAERVYDTGELLCEMVHSQTKSRAAFIIPILDDNGKAILKDTKPGKFLFGDKLTKKFKEGTTMIRVADSLRKFSNTNKNQLGAKKY
ncbi:hypothetical protein QAD02_014068 [Eretmocerus hayati]|uniref:Uncharacterized protein n=1 Tax=Eretmocerus hayati TaxID=131215 RepID=A0ACC2P603_9HYME|nr:hypothetical protein QAD02_014068 [Eretmocerus hayati]